MTFSSLLNQFLYFQVAIVISFCAIQIVQATFHLNFGQKLKLNYWAFLCIMCTVFTQPLLPKPSFFQPAAKVWAASSIKSLGQDRLSPAKESYISIATTKGELGLRTNQLQIIWLLVFSFLLSISLIKIRRALSILAIVRRDSITFRKIGRVRILSSEKYAVPFSFYWFGEAIVVLPQSIIEAGIFFRAATAHELQHHRQGDTIWLFLQETFRFFSLGNPILSIWLRHLAELQEFACDEAVLSQGKVNSQTYARCLFEVAKNASHQKINLAGATGMLFLVERNIIKRRVSNMLNISRMKQQRFSQTASVILIGVILGTTAWASKGIVKDRRISLEQAQALAEKAKVGSNFPIVMNELVLTHMNKFVGTPEGRGFMRDSLSRMTGYKGMIEKKLEEYELPKELMAVPIIESGFQNLGEKNKAGWGAGLWMFIKPTAISYGLTVNDKVDERLNEKLLTDAAMRYLKANHLRFRDWNLSTLAYNVGENNVEKAIQKTGSRDAFTLIQNGAENDRGYLPKLMAAIIIMKNPEILD